MGGPGNKTRRKAIQGCIWELATTVVTWVSPSGGASEEHGRGERESERHGRGEFYPWALVSIGQSWSVDSSTPPGLCVYVYACPCRQACVWAWLEWLPLAVGWGKP